MAQRYCNRCGEMVEDTEVDNDYNYYCPNCDEDLYTFETHEELVWKKSIDLLCKVCYNGVITGRQGAKTMNQLGRRQHV